MACEICNKIADDIQCQSCADYIIDECNDGNCLAQELCTKGSIDGHQISEEIRNLIK